MEAPWLPTVLNMLAYIPWQEPIIKDLIVDVAVGQALKVLPYLHLTLWLLSDVCYADRGSLSQSVRQWQGQSTSKVYQQCWKEWTGWCTCRVYQIVPYLPLN